MLCAPNAQWVAIEMEREALQSTAVKHLGRELALPRAGTLNLNLARPLMNELDRLIQRSLRPDADTRAMIAPITRAIAELLASHDPDILRRSLQRSTRRCKQLKAAESYIRSNLASDFDGKAFAAAMGLSERSLQLFFKDAYGMSPAHWARCLALHEARKNFHQIDLSLYTIESVARECGFHHMGRFSRYYKELFGESPSAMLGRRKENERFQAPLVGTC